MREMWRRAPTCLFCCVSLLVFVCVALLLLAFLTFCFVSLQELRVLQSCSHPFVVSLLRGGHFQTSGHLHLVLDYCPGGDLFSLFSRRGRLSEEETRMYAAELILALQHLHSRHIAYRDLKPENICLDARGHIVLVDFSLSRTDMDKAEGGKAMTFCGSEAYVAPEMLSRKGHDTRVDFWALGCVLFEALVGWHPFRGKRQGGAARCNREEMFRAIISGRVDYPAFLSSKALSLLRGLLCTNPDQRLGFGPVSTIAAIDQAGARAEAGMVVSPFKDRGGAEELGGKREEGDGPHSDTLCLPATAASKDDTNTDNIWEVGGGGLFSRGGAAPSNPLLGARSTGRT
ncbi:unnamed protein product, partial [Discosporangium mesarthrocarpum]